MKLFEDVPIVKSDRRQNLVFGWANVPLPVEKAAPEGTLENELDLVRTAFAATHPETKDTYYWITATFPDFVIVEQSGVDTGFFRFAYSRTEDDSFMFGEPVEVERTYVEKVLREDLGIRTPKVDLQGDFIEMEDLELGAYNFVLKSRIAGVNHEEIGVGSLVESMVITDDKLAALGLDADARGQVNKGWWLGFQVTDEVMDKVEDGTLAMFSIHGAAAGEDVVR